MDLENMDVLTVILLSYNHKQYIDKALDSIICQKTDFDFKILVADDASTDGTQEVLYHYKEKYGNRIDLLINKTNLGVEKNCHNALLSIGSRYYAFLEADDSWNDDNKLQLQVDALELNPDCSYCGHNTVFRDVIGHTDSPFITNDLSQGEVKKFDDQNAFRVHPSARMYRNMIDFSIIPPYMIYDTPMHYLFLTKGKLLYINRSMSIYNYTGQGMWSGRSNYDKKILTLRVAYKSNKFLQFKYDDRQSPQSRYLKRLKAIFRKNVAWFVYYWCAIASLHCRKFIKSFRI